jgi:hypothetical protein
MLHTRPHGYARRAERHCPRQVGLFTPAFMVTAVTDTKELLWGWINEQHNLWPCIRPKFLAINSGKVNDFPWFPSKCWVVTQIPRCTESFTCSPPNGNSKHFALCRLSPPHVRGSITGPRCSWGTWIRIPGPPGWRSLRWDFKIWLRVLCDSDHWVITTNWRPVLSSERTPTEIRQQISDSNLRIGNNIWFQVLEWARNRDIQNYWPSVVK